MFFKTGVFKSLYSQKTPVLESRFIKVAGLRLHRTPLVTACVIWMITIIIFNGALDNLLALDNFNFILDHYNNKL